MDIKDLKEYEDIELEKSTNLFKKKLDSLLKDDKTISPLDFFPEFSSELKKIAYTNWLGFSDSLPVQLPFFDVVILPIFPVREKEKFEKTVGLSVKKITELYHHKKVIPLPTRTPSEYVGLDYLDEILELKLPVMSSRIALYDESFSIATSGKSFNDNVHKIKTEARQKFRLLNIPAIKENFEQDFSNFSNSDKEINDLISEIISYYTHIDFMGYSELAKKIITGNDSVTVARQLKLYDRILHDVPLSSIDGAYTLDTGEIEAIKKIDSEPNKIFPGDVGKLLIKEFKLLRIENLEYDKVLEIIKDTSKARKALFDLDQAVQNEQKEKMIDRSLALKTKWQESNDVTISASNKNQKISKHFIPVSLGVMGSFASILQEPGILAAIAGTTVSIPFINRIINKSIMFRKPNHIASIYDLKQFVSNAEFMRV